MIAGRWTVEFLEGLNFSTAFISAAGITLDQGLTTSQLPIVDTLTAARVASMRTVGLIDSSKFGRRSLLPVADPRELDALVVDPGLAPETLEAYRQADIPISIAGEDRYNEPVNNADGTVP
jgi:DeoR/GlpR family transcriptional regulator of sugar metabolism